MKLEELITAIGGGAALGWLARWLQSRESRLAVEAKATAELEREKIRSAGRARDTEIREDHETGRHALVQLEKERQLTFVSQLGHAECMSHVADLQARVDLLERERAEDKARIAKLEDLVEALVSRLTRYESTPPVPAE